MVNDQFCSIIQWNRATWTRGTKRHGTSWQLDATTYRSHWREGGTGERVMKSMLFNDGGDE